MQTIQHVLPIYFTMFSYILLEHYNYRFPGLLEGYSTL